MAISKVSSIKVSERVFDLVDEQLDCLNEDDAKLKGYLSTFYNCREQGFWATIYSTDCANTHKEDLYIFVYEHRSSDEIVVIITPEHPRDGMYSDEDYENRRRFFHYNQYGEAADYIIEEIKSYFAIN